MKKIIFFCVAAFFWSYSTQSQCLTSASDCVNLNTNVSLPGTVNFGVGQVREFVGSDFYSFIMEANTSPAGDLPTQLQITNNNVGGPIIFNTQRTGDVISNFSSVGGEPGGFYVTKSGFPGTIDPSKRAGLLVSSRNLNDKDYLAHRAAGTFGLFGASDKWSAIGTPGTSLYGYRVQWNTQALTLNLQDASLDAAGNDKIAELQWGGGGFTNSRFNVNYLTSNTSAENVATFFSTGLVEIDPTAQFGAPGVTTTGNDLNIPGNDVTSITNLRLRVNGASLSTGGSFIGSDERIKQNVNTIRNPLEIINQLRGTTYEFKVREFPQYNLSPGKQYGFIAQEVAKVMPTAVGMADDNLLAIQYEAIIPVMVEGMKKQIAESDEMKTKISKLEQQVAEQQAVIERLSSLEERLRAIEEKLNIETKASNRNSQLFQNQPNPLNNRTVIPMQVAENATKAFVRVADASGRIVREITVDARGITQIELETGDLATGSYFYTLIVDNVLIDTKQMIVKR